MTVERMTTPEPAARVLAVWCAGDGDALADGARDAAAAADPSADPAAAVRLMARGATTTSDIRALRAPSLEELREAARDLRPTHVYVCGAVSSANAPNPALGRLGPLVIRRGGGGGGGGGRKSGDNGREASAHDIAGALAEAAPSLRCLYLDVTPSSTAPSLPEELLLALQQRRRRRRADGNGNGGEEEDEENPSDQVAVVAWASDPPAAVAGHFAQAFFAHLAHEPAAAPSPVAEAYGVALVATAALGAAGAVLPRMPELLLLSPPPSSSDGGGVGAAVLSDDAQFALPDARTVPLPKPEDLPAAVAASSACSPPSLDAIPGWRAAALLAPRCELRLRVAGGGGGGADGDGGGGDDDRVRLSYLGEGLRALLAAEVRSLELVAVAPSATAAATAAAREEEGAAAAAAPPPSAQQAPLLLETLDPSPCPLPEACRAVRAVVRTRSGVQLPVVMVLPDAVIDAANGGGGGAGGGAAAACNGNGNGNGNANGHAANGDSGAPLPSRPALARHALRHALLADALQLQLHLPPAGTAPPPQPRSQPDVAGGVPGVDCLARTSAWAAGLLRCLAYSGGGGGGDAAAVAAGGGAAKAAAAAGGEATGGQGGRGGEEQDDDEKEEEEEDGASFLGGRALAALGITAVGCTATRAISAADAERLFPLVGASRRPFSSRAAARDHGRPPPAQPQQQQRAEPPTHNPLAGGSAVFVAAVEALAATGPPVVAHVTNCARPPLAECSDEALAADMAAFWRVQQPHLLRMAAPTLGGAAINLPALYRAVVARGGFQDASAINWRGRVLPLCVAPPAARLAAAPGHALRRVYAEMLWPYEDAHVARRDVSGGERCPLCGRGDDDDAGLPQAEDWLACDGCDQWFHHSCDGRPGLPPYAAYEDHGAEGEEEGEEGGKGRGYHCPACAAGGGGSD